MRCALAAAVIASPLLALPAMADDRSSAAFDRPFGPNTMTLAASAPVSEGVSSTGSPRFAQGKPARDTSGTNGEGGVDDTVTGGDPKGD